MDRAMEGHGDVGLGYFGLNNYKYDFVGILMHAEHLEAASGSSTISVQIRPADDIDPSKFSDGISTISLQNNSNIKNCSTLYRLNRIYQGITKEQRKSVRAGGNTNQRRI